MFTPLPLSPFLALPRELRDQIYSHLFALPHSNSSGRELHGPLLLDVSLHIPESPLGVPSDTSIIPFSMLAPLCKCCKQLYWEATPFYLSSCILHLEDSLTTKWLIGWLNMFDKEGFKAVQHLEFDDFSRFEESVDHELLSLCSNLRSLTIHFRKTNNLATGKAIRPRAPMNRWQIAIPLGSEKSELVVEAYRLGIIFELKDLAELEFRFPDEKNVHVRQALSHALKGWFSRGWEERGIWVTVDCGFDDYW